MPRINQNSTKAEVLKSERQALEIARANHAHPSC